MNNSGERVLWFVVGAAIGVGATFLFGTREGRRFRRQVARMVEDGCEQLDEFREEFFEKGKEFYERGREYVEETGAKVGRNIQTALR